MVLVVGFVTYGGLLVVGVVFIVVVVVVVSGASVVVASGSHLQFVDVQWVPLHFSWHRSFIHLYALQNPTPWHSYCGGGVVVVVVVVVIIVVVVVVVCGASVVAATGSHVHNANGPVDVQWSTVHFLWQ